MKRDTSIPAKLSQNNLDLPVYTVMTVTLHTGVPAMTLRAWERRYQILVADRTADGYRLYSERDIESIKWLKQQIERRVKQTEAAPIAWQMKMDWKAAFKKDDFLRHSSVEIKISAGLFTRR